MVDSMAMKPHQKAFEIHAIFYITILFPLVCSAAAFAFDTYKNNGTVASTTRTPPSFDSSNNGKKVVQQQPEPSFYEVAQRIGKTVLRPGGSDATKAAHLAANIRPGDTVLELSAGMGRSGIELAQRYGAKVTLTDIDTWRLEMAKERADGLGLSDLVECKKMDMFHVADGLGGEVKFDVAQTEASLTPHLPRSRKAKFLKEVANHADKFILHEICFKPNVDEAARDLARREMSKVLNVGFCPETCEVWQKLLIDAGFDSIDYMATGDIAILNPLNMMRDEGVSGFAKIARNLATYPYLRKRMLATRACISKHSNELGYIAIVASKKK